MGVKGFWKKRTYWQKGAIIGIIYGILKSSYAISIEYSRMSSDAPISSWILIPFMFILWFALRYAFYFGFVGFLLGLFLEKKTEATSLKKKARSFMEKIINFWISKDYWRRGGIIGFIVGGAYQILIYVSYYVFGSYKLVKFVYLLVFVPLAHLFMFANTDFYEVGLFNFIAFVGWFTVLGVIFGWIYWIYNYLFKNKLRKVLTRLALFILIVILMLIAIILLNYYIFMPLSFIFST